MTARLLLCALIWCAVVIPWLVRTHPNPGATPVTVETEKRVFIPQAPGVKFRRRCADNHEPGVKITNQPCKQWEWALEPKDLARLLMYFRQLERIRQGNP